MTPRVTVTINGSGIPGFVEGSIRKALPAINRAMAMRFQEIWRDNFGPFGLDRPEWGPGASQLSAKYAKKVGRNIATLWLTGALRDSIMMGGFEADSVELTSGSPYAAAHQFGYGNLPKRPHCPIDENGNAMPFTLEQVILSAQRALEQELS